MESPLKHQLTETSRSAV